MPIQITGSIEGEQQLSRRLLVVADGVSDFGPPFERIKDKLLTTFDANFGARGSFFGGWAPRKKDYPWPILENTGTMRKNFQGESHRDFLKISNPTDYFKYHQSNQPRATALPRRIMMKIDNERKVFIQKEMQKYLVDIIRRSSSGRI